MNKRTKEGNISEKVRNNVLERDNYECVICHYNKTLELHHVIPRSHGGKGTENNLITLCHYHHDQVHFGKETKKYKELILKIMERINNGNNRID